MSAVLRARAETVHFDTDEGGFRLVVGTNAGDFVFNIHGCLLDLTRSYQETVAPYLAEGEAARQTRPGPVDLDAYEISDPKRIALEMEGH